MFDTKGELLEKIRLGEDSSFEFKEVRVSGDRVIAPSRDGLADELAALANSRGGVCVLGIEDTSREVLGIPLDQLDLVERFVRELCNDVTDPPLDAHIQRLFLPASSGDARAVLRIDLERSLFVHRSPGGYFLRVGSSKRLMRTEHLARLFQQRSQTRLVRFDEQAAEKLTLDSLEGPLWERFRTDLTRDGKEDFLHKLGIARTDDSGIWRPTVAGALIASRSARVALPNAFIQAVAYRGKSTVPVAPNVPYQLDARDLTGSVDEQVVEACRFVYRNMRFGVMKVHGQRDYPQFDLEALFEALVNAVVHRDYSIYGSKIRLRLFSDRLELYVPGAIANTLALEDLPYRQTARNETLASLMARIPVPKDLDWVVTRRDTFMDRRGEGVGLILQKSEELSGRRPVYRLVDDIELILTIYAAGVPEDEVTPAGQDTDVKE